MLAAEPCVVVGTMGYALLCHLESAQPLHGSHVVWWRGTDWPLCPLWWRERGSQARSLKLDPPEPSFLGKWLQRLKLKIYAVSIMNIFVYFCVCMAQLYVLYFVSSWLTKQNNMSTCLTCPNQKWCYKFPATINLFVYTESAVQCDVILANKWFFFFGPMRFSGWGYWASVLFQ